MGNFYLFTEGPDDEQAMYHLLSRYAIPISPSKSVEDSKISIQHKGSVESLLASLRVQLKPYDSEQADDRIGIIIDADADSNDKILETTSFPFDTGLLSTESQLGGLLRRWQSLKDLLISSGYTDVPESPSSHGTIVGLNQDEKPRIGVWLMPDNQVPGKLEHFAQFLIPSTDTLWKKVEQSIQNIPTEERLFPPKDEIKAKIHTWLAWQQEPGKPIGQAIRKGFLSSDSTHAIALITWVRRLFSF